MESASAQASAGNEDGNISRWLHIKQGFSHDHQIGMMSRNIEVMNVVAYVISIGKHPASRAYRQMKRETALVPFAARVHPRFHHTLTDWRGVVEFRQMLD